ncbi:MAG: hypothetical protein QNL91_07760 [Candidatus Krumholzibacteria bacterium]|nr:hypothetical protein [Candidatus Krumholzibacteria bacterium]
MKTLVVLLLVSLMATSAFAVIDPDTDMLGVYFDTTADNNCTTAAESIPFFAYVTITNPSAAEVHGIEFGYSLISSVGPGKMFRLLNTLPSGAVDLGTNTDLMLGDYVVGLAAPLPATEAVQFVTWQFLLLEPQMVEIYLGPSTIQSIDDGLPAYEIGGSIQSLGLSTGQPSAGVPVATVNGDCAVAVEDASFGSVKSLFR